MLERVQRVAEILALTPTTTRKKEPSTEREEKELNEGAFATDKEQERVALSLIDEEDDETELYSKIAALRLQLRRYKELASAAQKRNEEWETERLELTKETNELLEDELRSWFGEFSESVRCIQIGVYGVDKIDKYPFENCEQ